MVKYKRKISDFLIKSKGLCWSVSDIRFIASISVSDRVPDHQPNKEGEDPEVDQGQDQGHDLHQGQGQDPDRDLGHLLGRHPGRLPDDVGQGQGHEVQLLPEFFKWKKVLFKKKKIKNKKKKRKEKEIKEKKKKKEYSKQINDIKRNNWSFCLQRKLGNYSEC